VWATGTQLVRFSTGANEMIDQQRPDSDTPDYDPVMTEKPDFDPGADDPSETVEGGPVEPIEGRWSIEGVGRVDESGESLYDMHWNALSTKVGKVLCEKK